VVPCQNKTLKFFKIILLQHGTTTLVNINAFYMVRRIKRGHLSFSGRIPVLRM